MFFGSQESTNLSGQSFMLSSRLIPRHYFENDPAGVAKAILDGQDILSTVGPNYLQSMSLAFTSPSNTKYTGKTSVNPIWYESLWQVYYGGKPIIHDELCFDEHSKAFLFTLDLYS
jgi:hypothetical protein